MKYISLNWTLAVYNWKEKENARLPNSYGARLYYILLTKATAMQNEVALSYHSVRGLYSKYSGS